jgi:hypothetical protein
MQAATSDPVLDRIATETKREELRPRNHPMLLPSERPDRRVKS